MTTESGSKVLSKPMEAFTRPEGFAGGYAGRLLRVDLTSGTLTSEVPDQTLLRNYPGGSSLGARYLYNEVPPGVEWSDPENRVIMAGGPLSGSRVPGSGTFSIVTKGPMTNGATTTQANGFFGAFMKFAGFDGIILQGASDNLCYLYIHDGTAELRDAAHLADKTTTETEQIIKAELGKSVNTMSVFSIGPAGENLVRYACFVGDRGHVAAHNGTGAVMGSKKLKAIAIARSEYRPPQNDPDKFGLKANEYRDYIKNTDDQIAKWGTLNLFHRASEMGTLLTKNYTTNVYDPNDFADFTAENIRDPKYNPQRHSCWACSMHHCHTMTIPDGRHAGKVVEEPEYEGLTAWGSQIGNTNLNETLVLSELVDALGMDINESSWTVGLMMECYEKGLVSAADMDGLEMTWGNVDAATELLHKIARRQGVGDMLAEGARRSAQKIGGEAPNFAVHTMKGNTPRSHDHRLSWREMFDTSVSNTSTLEAGWQIAPPHLKDFGLTPLTDPFAPMEISSYVAGTKGGLLFEDSLGVCTFCTKGQVSTLVESINAATGWDLTTEAALSIGLRAVNLLRAFNLRHGITGEMDAPSPRYGSTPTDGKMAGKGIGPVFKDMVKNYYEKLGWDVATGKPKPETLEKLGIAEVAADIW